MSLSPYGSAWRLWTVDVQAPSRDGPGRRKQRGGLLRTALRHLDGAEQALLRRVGRDEEILGHLRHVAQHVGVDHIRLIEIQPEPGQILQPQVATVVDLRAAEPRLEIALAA